MIEKLNFYDVYGYLIPGLVLIGLFWIPFGLVLHQWPKAELASAILVLVLAYVLGHLIQITVRGMLPPTVKDPLGNTRFPSDMLLDSESQDQLSEKLQDRIAWRCWGCFEIDISARSRVFHWEGNRPDPQNRPETKCVRSQGRAARLSSAPGARSFAPGSKDMQSSSRGFTQ